MFFLDAVLKKTTAGKPKTGIYFWRGQEGQGVGEIVELEVLAQASPLPSCVSLGKSHNLSGTYPLLISHRGDTALILSPQICLRTH